MFGNFSEDARQAISIAIQDCRKINIGQMRPLHLMMGIIRSQSGAGIRILKGLQVDVTALEATLTAMISSSRSESPEMKVIFAPETKACFELAVLSAKRMAHHPVGTEHLLLSLLTVNDEEINALMKNFPIDLEILPNYIKRLWEERREYAWDRILKQLPVMATPELASMLNKLDEGVNRLLEIAYSEAMRYHNSFLDVEHLLLALVKVVSDRPSELPIASIKNLDVMEIRQRIEDKVGIQSDMYGGEMTFTIRAKKVIEIAVQEAFLMGENRVHLHHILIGLLGYEKGFAGDLLMTDLAAVRNELLKRKVQYQRECFASLDISRYKIDRDLLPLIPSDLAHKYQVVPLHQRHNCLTVALVDPGNEECIAKIEELTRLNVFPVVAAEHWIKVILEKYYPHRT